MLSSTTSILICIAAIWLAQRLLTIQQVVQFRKQLAVLRREGLTSVGIGKARGRRVFAALAYDPHDRVASALILKGMTVFSHGRPEPLLVGCRAKDLAAGRGPNGLPRLVAQATRQSAELLLEGRRDSPTAARATASPAPF